MKRERGPMPRLQVLVYPATDLACRDGSMVTCATCHALTTEKIEDLKANYMTDVERESRDVRVSPMYEPDLAGLPAALVVTAGFDPLRDQGEAYANKLDDSGVEVSYRCEDGLCHGFTAMGGVVPAARAACHALAGDIGRMLRADPPRRTRGSPRGKVRDRRE
jgi:acetyl esterase/lipase